MRVGVLITLRHAFTNELQQFPTTKPCCDACCLMRQSVRSFAFQLGQSELHSYCCWYLVFTQITQHKVSTTNLKTRIRKPCSSSWSGHVEKRQPRDHSLETCQRHAVRCACPKPGKQTLLPLALGHQRLRSPPETDVF